MKLIGVIELEVCLAGEGIGTVESGWLFESRVVRISFKSLVKHVQNEVVGYEVVRKYVCFFRLDYVEGSHDVW